MHINGPDDLSRHISVMDIRVGECFVNRTDNHVYMRASEDAVIIFTDNGIELRTDLDEDDLRNFGEGFKIRRAEITGIEWRFM